MEKIRQNCMVNKTEQKTNFSAQKIRQINQSQTFIANFTTYCFKFEKGRARHKSHLPKTKNNMVGVGEQLPPRLQK